MLIPRTETNRSGEPAPQPPRLLDQVRDAVRTRHCSYRTEQAYVAWIRRFILFHRKRHPAEMGREEIERFLSALAVDRQVSASTQNQALSMSPRRRGIGSTERPESVWRGMLYQSCTPTRCSRRGPAARAADRDHRDLDAIASAFQLADAH